MLERFRVSDTRNGGQIEDMAESNYRIGHTLSEQVRVWLG